jgi:hypothetical protein
VTLLPTIVTVWTVLSLGLGVLVGRFLRATELKVVPICARPERPISQRL